MTGFTKYPYPGDGPHENLVRTSYRGAGILRADGRRVRGVPLALIRPTDEQPLAAICASTREIATRKNTIIIFKHGDLGNLPRVEICKISSFLLYSLMRRAM
ncbi:MAG TPA: hypothetical protein VGR45_05125 [Stellaceae bacterium]|nr:hypothetical protein [Stellaceae bacterium]